MKEPPEWVDLGDLSDLPTLPKESLTSSLRKFAGPRGCFTSARSD